MLTFDTEEEKAFWVNTLVNSMCGDLKSLSEVIGVEATRDVVTEYLATL